MFTRTALVWAIACSWPAAWAQATRSELHGVVLDALRLPVGGAAVELFELSTGASSTGRTDARGEFSFVALPPGGYRIRILKAGFRRLQRDGITLRVGEHVHLELGIEVGDVSQVIEVTAQPPMLQSERGSVSFAVDRVKLVNLPLDGRNFVPLIALSAGVGLPPGSTLPRINGSRPRVNEYLYDGVSVLQPEPGQVAYFPVIDAIEEFRVETGSYSAEFGRANGGIIMVNQKSGGNQFHGAAFEFLRNEALNARNFFAPPGPQPRFRRNQYGFVLGGPIQKNRTFFFVDWQGTRLETGRVRVSTVPSSLERAGVFGAPVFDPATTRPAGTAVARDPFPNNAIPTSRFDPAALRVLGRYPAPNVVAGGREAAANNFRRVGNDDVSQDQFDVRVDRHFGRRHRVFGRYSFLRDLSRPVTPLPDGSGNLASGVIADTLTHAGGAAAEHTWILAPDKVNQMRFGHTRRAFHRASLRTGQPAWQVSGIPNVPVSAYPDVLPTFELAGFQLLGPAPNGNVDLATRVTQFLDNFTWVAGRHSLKFGTDVRLQALDALQPPSPTGQFQFTNVLTAALTAAGTPAPGTGSSLASFLLGQVQHFQVDVQKEVLSPRAAIGEFYVQDDLRLSRRLALNLGVRYTLNFPSTVVGDRGAAFNLRTQQLDFLGRDGHPRSVRNLEKADFGPRAGLAYRLAGSLVLRSGYGLTWIEQAGITTPFTTPLFPFIRAVQQFSLDNLNPAFVLSQGPTVNAGDPVRESGLGESVFAVQRDQKSGYAQQWNVFLQKSMGATWSVEAGYAGSKLTNLGVPDVNMNQLRVEQFALGPGLTRRVANPFFGEIPATSQLGSPTIARHQLVRPYPRFGSVSLYRNNVGHSTYHSLQARAEKRFSRGLAFTAAYTFSRLIDDAGAVFDTAILSGPVTAFQAADSHNRRLEKDVSTGNMPHIFAAGFVWDLPAGGGGGTGLRRWRRLLSGGWRIAGIARAQSGSPIAITQQPNLNAFAGFGIQRPNRLRDPALPPGRRSAARWFDTAAFAQAPQFTIGDSSRNPVAGPQYRTVDLMASKTFAITEGLRTELRLEAFNAFNTPPLGNPNGQFGTPGFGSVTSAFDPRVFEFVLKLHF